MIFPEYRNTLKMYFPYRALPRNPSLWSLHKLHEQASRWLDHTENQEDYETVEEFITELEIKINELSEAIDFLARCISHE